MKVRRPPIVPDAPIETSGERQPSSTGAKQSSENPKYRVFLTSNDRDRVVLPSGSGDLIVASNIAHLTVVTARLFDRLLSTRLRPHGVPLGQWPILLLLWANEDLSQRELSQLMAVEESTVTNTVNRMTRDGLLSRVRAATNRRRNQLKLTERGRALLPKLVPEALGVVETATRGMSEIEIAFLFTLLRKLQLGLVDERVRPLGTRVSDDLGSPAGAGSNGAANSTAAKKSRRKR